VSPGHTGPTWLRFDGWATQVASAFTVRSWLKVDGIKPSRYRPWTFVRDPNFQAKAAHVLDLYTRTFDGEPVGEGEYVISSDEQTSIQLLILWA
jgi:hypothetical protein